MDEMKQVQKIFKKNLTNCYAKVAYKRKNKFYIESTHEEIEESEFRTSNYIFDYSYTKARTKSESFWIGTQVILEKSGVILKYHIFRFIPQTESLIETKSLYPVEPAFMMLLIQKNGNAYEYFQNNISRVKDIHAEFNKINSLAVQGLGKRGYNVNRFKKLTSGNWIHMNIINHLFGSQEYIYNDLNGDMVHVPSMIKNNKMDSNVANQIWLVERIIRYGFKIDVDCKDSSPTLKDVDESMEWLDKQTKHISQFVKKQTTWNKHYVKKAFLEKDNKDNIVLRFFTFINKQTYFETMRIIVDSNEKSMLFVKTLDNSWKSIQLNALIVPSLTHQLHIDETIDINNTFDMVCKSIDNFDNNVKTNKIVDYLVMINDFAV